MAKAANSSNLVEKKLLAPEYSSLIACIIDDEGQGEGQTHMKLLENIASAFGFT
jgi:hypothetical protein